MVREGGSSPTAAAHPLGASHLPSPSSYCCYRCVITKSSYTSRERFDLADEVHDCIGEKGETRFSLSDLAMLVERRIASRAVQA